jgi:hypothetical protein
MKQRLCAGPENIDLPNAPQHSTLYTQTHSRCCSSRPPDPSVALFIHYSCVADSRNSPGLSDCPSTFIGETRKLDNNARKMRRVKEAFSPGTCFLGEIFPCLGERRSFITFRGSKSSLRNVTYKFILHVFAYARVCAVD